MGGSACDLSVEQVWCNEEESSCIEGSIHTPTLGEIFRAYSVVLVCFYDASSTFLWNSANNRKWSTRLLSEMKKCPMALEKSTPDVP
jgi:hypothetical protein